MREWEFKKANTYIFAVDLCPKLRPFLRKMPLRELFLSQMILQITNIMKSHTLLNKRCQEEPFCERFF